MENEVNWQLYEELVKDIYQVLGKSSGVTIECWGPSCRVSGKSGAAHQIDILTSHSDGIHTYKTAIECKFWNKKVPKDAVMKLSEILSDTNIEKGVLVSKSGFTSDAKKIAESKNISLVELRKPVDHDWNDSLNQIDIEFKLCIDEICDYQFVLYDVADSEKEDINLSTYDSCIYIKDQNPLLIREFVEKIIRSNKESKNEENFCWTYVVLQRDKEKNYSVKFLDKTTVSGPKSYKKWKIRKLNFKVKEVVVTENIQMNFADYIAMIMHSIFEDKKFAVFSDMSIISFQP